MKIVIKIAKLANSRAARCKGKCNGQGGHFDPFG